jgi:hypothetical protein
VSEFFELLATIGVNQTGSSSLLRNEEITKLQHGRHTARACDGINLPATVLAY